jgi:hypothetical protein
MIIRNVGRVAKLRDMRIVVRRLIVSFSDGKVRFSPVLAKFRRTVNRTLGSVLPLS